MSDEDRDKNPFTWESESYEKYESNLPTILDVFEVIFILVVLLGLFGDKRVIDEYILKVIFWGSLAVVVIAVIVLLLCCFIVYLIGSAIEWILNWFKTRDERLLKKLVKKLAPNVTIHIRIKDDVDVANACATEDIKGRKYIFVTRPLLKKVSKEELYFIVAHEIAHHLKNHIDIKRNLEMTKMAMTASLIILSIIRLIKSIPFLKKILNFPLDILFSLLSEAMMGFALNKTVYYQHELEADVEGVRLLKEAGLPIRGAYDLLKRCEEEENFMDKVLGFFLDEHPTPAKRVQNLVEHYPELKQLVDEYNWPKSIDV